MPSDEVSVAHVFFGWHCRYLGRSGNFVI